MALRSKLFFHIYNFVKGKKYKRIRVMSLEKNMEPYVCLLQQGSCEISPPNFTGNKVIVENNVPPVLIYRIEHAIVSCDLSAIWCGDSIFIDENYNVEMTRANYKSGPLKIFDLHFCLLRFDENSAHDEWEAPILFLGGSASFNYYHWLIEILPKLFALDASTLAYLNIEKVLVPPGVLANNNLKNALEQVVRLKKFNIKIISGGNNFSRFREVYYVNSFNNVLINAWDKKSLAIDSHFSQELLVDYARLLKQENIKLVMPRRKIFILRKEESVSSYNKRRYNQEDIFAIAKKFGFSGVYLEDLSFSEQVNTFASATHIIGPSGAAWANIIFCDDACLALSWLSALSKDFSVYSTLAHYAGGDLRFLEAKLDNPEDLHGPYYLNPRDLEYFLKNEWKLME